MALYRDVQPGDVLHIGTITIGVEQKTGQRTRLRIDGAAAVEHIKASATPVMSRPDIAPQRHDAMTQAQARKPRLTMPQTTLSI